MARSWAWHSAWSDEPSTCPSSGSGRAGTHDAPMHDGPLVHPPHVARPLRLRPFRGLTLDASRIGAPASVRAFTRPYDQVADRLESWARRGQLRHDRRRRSTSTSTRSVASRSGAGRSPGHLPGRAGPGRRGGDPARGIHPRQVGTWPPG